MLRYKFNIGSLSLCITPRLMNHNLSLWCSHTFPFLYLSLTKKHWCSHTCTNHCYIILASAQNIHHFHLNRSILLYFPSYSTPFLKHFTVLSLNPVDSSSHTMIQLDNRPLLQLLPKYSSQSTFSVQIQNKENLYEPSEEEPLYQPTYPY